MTCLQNGKYFLVDCQEYVPICMYAPQIGEAPFGNVHYRMILVSEKHGFTGRISIEILFQTCASKPRVKLPTANHRFEGDCLCLVDALLRAGMPAFFRLKLPSAGLFCFEAISLVDALQVDQALGRFMSFCFICFTSIWVVASQRTGRREVFSGSCCAFVFAVPFHKRCRVHGQEVNRHRVAVLQQPLCRGV